MNNDTHELKDVKVVHFLTVILTQLDSELHLTDEELEYYENLNWYAFIKDAVKEDVMLGRSLSGMFKESLELLKKLTKFE